MAKVVTFLFFAKSNIAYVNRVWYLGLVLPDSPQKERKKRERYSSRSS